MKKGDARSFRFNEARINFAKEKLKLNNRQEVLDYLIDEFWFKHNSGLIMPDNTGKTPPKVEYIPINNTQKQEKSFQQHMNEISELEYEPEYRKKAIEIQAATNLSPKEKDLLLFNIKKTDL